MGDARAASRAEFPFVGPLMVRVVIYVTLLAALFGGAVLSAGNAIGAWEPIPPSPHVLGTSTQGESPKKKQKAPAKPRKHHKAKQHS
jgi:hypothetical protein